MPKRARREEYVRLSGHMPAEKTGAQGGSLRARAAQGRVCARRSMHGGESARGSLCAAAEFVRRLNLRGGLCTAGSLHAAVYAWRLNLRGGLCTATEFVWRGICARRMAGEVLHRAPALYKSREV